MLKKFFTILICALAFSPAFVFADNLRTFTSNIDAGANTNTLVFTPTSTITIENVYLQDESTGNAGSEMLDLFSGSAQSSTNETNLIAHLKASNSEWFIGLNSTTSQPLSVERDSFGATEHSFVIVQYYPYDIFTASSTINSTTTIEDKLSGYTITALQLATMAFGFFAGLKFYLA